MELDDTICYCFHISKRKIVNFIRIHQPKRPSQISECGGAGTGCGWCRKYLERCYMESKGLATEVPDLNPQTYAQQRADYIRAGHGTPASGAIPLPPDEPPTQ